MRASILLAAFVLAAAGCRSANGGDLDHTGPDPVVTDTAALTRSRWVPVELAGRPVPPPAPGAQAPYLQFDAGSGRVHASAGCNGMSGRYTVNGDSLRVDEVASTLMLCADSAVMARETALGRALQEVRRWRIEGGTLLLLSATETLGRFRPAGAADTTGGGGEGDDGGAAAAEPIENVAWRLASLGGADVVGDPPYFRLDASTAHASGNGGCNNFRGPYALSGEHLALGPLVATRRACDSPARNAQGTALLRALESTKRWRLEGDALVLLDDAGEVARFRAEGR